MLERSTTGQVWWSHDASSYRGIALDDDALYIANADGEVVALRRRTGAEIWRQKALLHRGLSAVALTDNAVVTADYQGNVHWLDKATGELAARVPSGKVRVSNPPIVSGNMVFVINDAGRISAFRTTPIGRAMWPDRRVCRFRLGCAGRIDRDDARPGGRSVRQQREPGTYGGAPTPGVPAPVAPRRPRTRVSAGHLRPPHLKRPRRRRRRAPEPTPSPPVTAKALNKTNSRESLRPLQ